MGQQDTFNEVCELQSCSEDYEHLHTEKKRLWADKMVQWEKVWRANSKDLSSIPQTHVIKGVNQFL